MAKDKDDKLALIVENANTKLIEIINEAVVLGYNKTYSKTRVINLIDETTNELKKNEASDVLIESTKLALQKAFMKEWLQVIVILEEKLNKDELGYIGKQIEAMKTNTPMDLRGGKGITIDIVDSKGNNKLSNSNRKWIELTKGLNTLSIDGVCDIRIEAYYPIMV